MMDQRQYKPHLHAVVNVNRKHEEEIGVNQWLALQLTRSVGTMWAAYAFAALAILGFPGLHASATSYVQWLSQTFIQLVMLSVLAVSQRLLSRHAELQADEAYATTVKIFHDVEVLINQQNEVIRQQEAILRLFRSDASTSTQVLSDIYATLQTCATVADVKEAIERMASRLEMRLSEWNL